MGKKYIKNFYNRDRLALTSISKCGYCTKEQLKIFIADKRLTNYERDSLVSKEVFNKNDGEQLVAYRLTNNGRRLIEKQWGVKNHYIAQSITHDLGISSKYFSLNEEQRETWKTETEIRQEFEQRLEELRYSDYERYGEVNKMLEDKLISVPDCAYRLEIDRGIETYFEVITNAYGQAEIEAKERFVEIMNIKAYETKRV